MIIARVRFPARPTSVVVDGKPVPTEVLIGPFGRIQDVHYWSTDLRAELAAHRDGEAIDVEAVIVQDPTRALRALSAPPTTPVTGDRDSWEMPW